MWPTRFTSPAGDPAPVESSHISRSDWLLRYGSVVVSVILAAFLRIPLRPLLGNKVAFITLFPAIVYSAWIAGWGGGLLATALCVAVAAWFIIPPATSLLVAEPADQISLLVFVGVGVTISVLGHAQHLAQRRAETSSQEAARNAAAAEQNAAVLRESEARKVAMLEAALDCIITIDEQERVIEWNPAAERTFGYSRFQALGRPLSTLIIPLSLRGAHERGIAHYLKTGEGPVLNKRIEVPALHADGTEFLVELTAVPINLGGRSLFTAYLRDLTERERSAAQQRAFLRDVLLSVTEGRLHLCHVPSDLPLALPMCDEQMALSMDGGMAALRQQIRLAAVAQGFMEERWHDLVIAASEAAMNAVVHAGGGQGRICSSETTLQVWVEDQGKGIDVAHIPQATLEKGYSSAGTLGHGMKMMLSTADRVWLLTGSSGTTVVLEQDRLPPVAKWLQMDAPKVS